MLSRIGLAIAITAGAIIGMGAFGFTDAQAARWYDHKTKQWLDEKPQEVIRPLSQRKVPSKFKRKNVMISTNEAPGTIIIHTDEKFLYYVTAPNKAIRFGVGVGREGFGWNGEVTVKRKQEWPTWTPPAEMRARERENGRILPASMEGGPENPLGARALYLFKGNQDTMYRIHGTNQPWSIGLNLSSGCIRMMNEDVEALYDMAEIGTKVIVIGPGEDANKYFNAKVNPLAAIFGGG
jgi:lipoprotein-anchoring transpeptidase ErfK/SrfK